VKPETIAAAWGAAALLFLLGYLVGYRFGVLAGWRGGSAPASERQDGGSARDNSKQDPAD